MVFGLNRPLALTAVKTAAAQMALVISLLLTQSAAQAQSLVDLSGFWQKKGEAFVMQITMDESTNTYSATIVRADWEPGKVDSVSIQGVTPDPEAKRWDAQVFDFDRREFRDGSIAVVKDNRFILRAAGQRRSTWVRIPSAKELL